MIEVKNYGTSIIALAFKGQVVTLKPQQSVIMEKAIYETYITVFPNLRPVVEHAIIESDTKEIELPKAKKNVSKSKKRGK